MRHELSMAGMGAVFLTLMMGTALAPRAGQSVAVIANPFTPHSTAAAAKVVMASGGRLEEAALSGRLIIATAPSPDFVGALYRNGALFVFNPRVLAGCRRS